MLVKQITNRLKTYRGIYLGFAFVLYALTMATAQRQLQNSYEELITNDHDAYQLLSAAEKGVFLYRTGFLQNSLMIEFNFLDNDLNKKMSGIIPAGKNQTLSGVS